MTLETLGDADAIGRISESLAAWNAVSLVLTWPPFARTWPGARHRGVTGEPGQQYEIRFQPSARRAIARRAPGGRCRRRAGVLRRRACVNPHRLGKPLFGPLAGCHGARRGTYRIVYRIDENSRIVNVLDNDHRPEIYRRRQR